MKKGIDKINPLCYTLYVPKNRKEVSTMEKTYTEQEIKEWFAIMLKKYEYSPSRFSLEHVRSSMFDDCFRSTNLDKILHKD